MNWYERSALQFKENHPDQVKELKRLFMAGNDIKTLSQYMGWSQLTIVELLEEELL
jgi:hypothetical protein